MNEYEINKKCETNIKVEDEIVDIDTYLKILKFLIHLQNIGVIDEAQITEYSKYIQKYLKESKEDLDFLEDFLKYENKF